MKLGKIKAAHLKPVWKLLLLLLLCMYKYICTYRYLYTIILVGHLLKQL